MSFRLRISIAWAALTTAAIATAADVTVFAGTYTGPASKGIYSFHFDSVTGKLSNASLVADAVNPSFLAIHPNGKFLYAANELASGRVSAFAIDAGKLIAKNSVASGGADPCHLAVDQTGRWLFAANYSSGSVAVFPIREDGSLGEASALDQHAGSGVVAQRQDGPHAHEAVLSPDNRFLLVTDLGLDEVFVYGFDASKGTLAKPQITKLKPGSGPRHMAFSPDGRFLYVLNELTATVDAFRWDSQRGTLEPADEASMLPADYAGPKSGAEIAIDPAGRFLYASNRGHDSIAIFRIDKGKLIPQGHASTGGKTPRNFVLDPAGNFLLAANRDSSSVVEFRIDKRTGALAPTGERIEIPSPVSLVFSAPRASSAVSGRAPAD